MAIDKVTRVENKYFISTHKKLELIDKLKCKMEEDMFGKQGYYSIRSVYFDTGDFKDYFAKINNLDIKKSVRLRIYSPYDSMAKLELKFKKNNIQDKISLKLDKKDAERILMCDFEVLKDMNSEIAMLFYILLSEGNYRPTTTIFYDRKAFHCKKTRTRITIDSNLQYSNHEFNIWKEELELDMLSSVNEHILEIKIDPRISDKEIDNIIFPLEIVDQPSSKYKRCCKFLAK